MTKEEEDWKAEQEFKEYCGFSCADLLQKQQEIINELLDFNKYNPEYSVVMLGKCMEKLYECRQDMLREMKTVNV